MTAQLFQTRSPQTSLPLQDEQLLILEAKAGIKSSMWQLLVQYSGLLQSVSYDVRSRIRKMTPEQIEDLEGALVLAAIEAIHAFDQGRFVRLSQVLPGKLKDVALELTTALAVPRGTLNLWFKIWRAGGQDFDIAASLAPDMGMTANTFRAISHALEYAGSEWVTVPFDGTKGPTPDTETYALAHLALSMLTPQEREIIELAYGFRGDAKSDQDVADLVGVPRDTAKKRRGRALEKMRAGLTEQQ